RTHPGCVRFLRTGVCVVLREQRAHLRYRLVEAHTDTQSVREPRGHMVLPPPTERPPQLDNRLVSIQVHIECVRVPGLSPQDHPPHHGRRGERSEQPPAEGDRLTLLRRLENTEQVMTECINSDDEDRGG